MKTEEYTPHNVLLSFGSNVADKSDRVAEAIEWVGSLFSELQTSPEYETRPLSGKGSPYMNAVGRGVTPLPYEALAKMVKELEIRMGRDEESRRKGEVPIDIDIVMFDGEILRRRDYDADFFKQGLLTLEENE